MSSVQSFVSSPSHGARFFVATRASAPIYNENGSVVTVGSPAVTQTAALGQVVRDMGKTIRTPGISSLASSVLTQVVLRKVTKAGSNATALAAGGVVDANGFVGFSEGAQDSRNATLTYYINVYDGYWASI
jgi:hypothetical protein